MSIATSVNKIDRMKPTSAFAFSVVCAAATAAFSMNTLAAEITGRVISSTPVVEQIAVPRQVCSGQTVTTEAPKSGAGFALGALAGGAAGNAIGNGSGRAVATFIGLVGGGLLGNQVARRGNRTEGSIIGAAVGALAGRAIDKSDSNCRRR